MKKVFFSLLIVLVCFINFSCSNFLKGSDIKKNIEDEIAISTAPTITVRLGSETGTGTFPSVRDISVKVGFKFSVEFILNSADYKFNKWTFTDAKDTSRNLEEYVKYETTISENVYTLDISILTQIDNLLIKPDCILIPKAVKQLPEMIEEGKPQDSTIVVVFNTPVNAEDFDGTFNNISIKSGGVEIAEEFFNPPVLSSDKKNLSITPVASKKLIENVTENGTRDITVTLKTGKIVDSNGNVLREPLLNENGDCPFYNDISWTYRVNQNQDGEAPVIHSVSLFADAEEKRVISTDEYTTWTTKRDENGKNDFDRHHVRELFVKINGSDVGGGIRCVKVSELLVKNQGGEELNSEEVISFFGEGIFENDILIPLSFANIEDGLVTLKISILDYAGNESEKISYALIKDTVFESSFIHAKLVNTTSVFDEDFKDSTIYSTKTLKEFREADEFGIDTVEIDCSNTYKYFYEKKDCPLLIYIESSYDGIIYTDENVTQKDNNTFVLKRKADLNTFVRITCEDDVGNKRSVIRIIPKTISIIETPVISNVSASYKDVFVFTASDIINLYKMKNFAGANSAYYSILYRKNDYVDSDVYSNKTGIDISGSYYGSSGDKSQYFKISQYDGNNSKVFLNTSTEYYYYTFFEYKYNETEVWNGCIGRPFKLQLKSSKMNSNGIFEYELATSHKEVDPDAIPEFFYVYIDKAEQNTGKRKISVKFNSEFNSDPECTYIIEYKKSKSTTASNYSEKLEFEVESGYIYDFNLIIKDKEGNAFKHRITRSIDATFDNGAPEMVTPSWQLYQDVYESSKIRLLGQSLIKDSTGLYMENNLIPFTYFVVKNQNNTASVLKLSRDELYKNYNPKKVYFDTIVEDSSKSEQDGVYMDFYFDEKDEGYYSIFIETKDRSSFENNQLISFYVNKRLMNKKLIPVFSYNSSGNIIANNSETLNLNKNGGYLPYIYLAGLSENNHWVKDKSTNSITSWTVNSAYNNSFLKCSGRCSKGNYDVTYYSTVNFDPLNPVICENKNLMKCETGYQVFADSGKPVFIHTMVSQYNYGTNKQDWYNKAIETNLKLKKNGGSFSYHPDFSHYPEDYWMTVIVHFADDDAVMSYPMQIKDYR